MSEKCGNSPRSVSAVDAKNITVPSTQRSNPLAHHPANPPGNQLLSAMWRSPDLFHQIGILDRQSNKFKNIPVKDAADAVAQAQTLSNEGKEVYFACAEYLSPDSRVAANAYGARAFWMDIDCGDDKAAADTRLMALRTPSRRRVRRV